MVRKKRKIHRRIRRKPRIGFFLALIIPALTILYVSSLLLSPQKVEILYFRNDECPIVKSTDVLINQAIDEFGDRISVRTINAQLYTNEPEDSEEIKRLRERYNVIGLPDIIINGKKLTKKFDRNNLFSEICNNFIVKPEACL